MSAGDHARDFHKFVDPAPGVTNPARLVILHADRGGATSVRALRALARP